MPKGGVVPNCRYGHGDLWKIEGEGFPKRYLLTGEIPLISRDAEGRLVDIEQNGILLSAWECRTCGYTELFEADNNGQTA